MTIFIFLPFDGDINAALGSIILGGYVYIVKYILPNQETVNSGSHFSEESLRVNQRQGGPGGMAEEERQRCTTESL